MKARILKEKLLDDNCVGSFTYMWGMTFFIETSLGNFVWSDPDYQGDNTIRPFNGSYNDACKACHVPYGRDKGKHLIREYCGEEFTVVIDNPAAVNPN